VKRRASTLLRRDVFRRDRGICARCGVDTLTVSRELPDWPSHRVTYWDADHEMPVVEGGSSELENVRTLCLPCHRAVTAELAERRGSDILIGQYQSRSVLLTVETWREIERLARDGQTSRSAVIRDLVLDALRRRQQSA